MDLLLLVMNVFSPLAVSGGLGFLISQKVDDFAFGLLAFTFLTNARFTIYHFTLPLNSFAFLCGRCAFQVLFFSFVSCILLPLTFAASSACQLPLPYIKMFLVCPISTCRTLYSLYDSICTTGYASGHLF